MMTNYSHLSREQRNIIEHLISLSKTLTYIGSSVNVDRTTIAKEIKRNRYVKGYSNPFDQKIINNAVSNCSFLQKPPYVCNNCSNKRYCIKHKLYYNANTAQKHYEQTLSTAREGIDITPEVIEQIENTIVPLIKDKKQSINQVYINHPDILFISKTTFYKYIDMGVLSLANIDLTKKVIYKNRKRKKSNEYKRKLALLKGRSYEEFLTFSIDHPNMNICEMDTVEGNKGGKVFLTILIRDTKFMFIRLLDKKNIAYVNKEIDLLKRTLGIKLFSKIFRIVLTDNGTEFFDPMHIEFDYETGNKTCNVFYCKPYSSFQKPNIERNHEYIRRIFPKGETFNYLTDEQVKSLETIINNIPREKLGGKTPYELTKDKYPLLLDKLHYQYIEPDNVALTKDNVLGVNK